MKKNYSKFLVVLLALAMILPGFTQLASADEDMPEVIRLSGKTRVETSIKVSEKAYGNGEAKTAILAGYHGEADALTGTLLAEAKDAPILLTYKGNLDLALSAELDRLGTEKVYILGGTHVVGAEVETALEAKGLEVIRLSGSTRVETAVNIAKAVFGTNKPAEAFFVEYHALSDALAIGPVAAMKKAPILITQSSKVPTVTKNAINDMGITKGTIIGGNNALSDAGKAALETVLGTSIPRVYGSDRVQTSLKIANEYFNNPEAVIVANGWTLADALVGGYFGEMMNAPVLLSQTDKIHSSVLAYIKDVYKDTYVLGGSSSISEKVLNEIKGLFDKEDETPPVVPVDPPVPGTYKILLSAEDMELVGDGESNTTIHVQLVDNVTGERLEINGLQVKLTTDQGQLADEKITLQKGYGHTTLNSENVSRYTDVNLLAEIIESSVPVAYKKNITGMTAKLGLVFTTLGGMKLEDIPQLVKAESNQADRVTLYFDRNVIPEQFRDLANSVAVIKQGTNPVRVVRGFHRFPGNDEHTIEVILDKETPLIDNKTVDVKLTLKRGKNYEYSLERSTSFILTDNRKPQATEVKHDGNMRKIHVWFSESIVSANFNLDGGTNPINDITYHDYDQGTMIDHRHEVELDVEYLAPGEHTLQVSAPKDFAYASDSENIGTTQEFTFTVKANDDRPTVQGLTVESPEQYRIKLDNASRLATGKSLQDVRLEMESAPGVWQEITLLNLGGPAVSYPDHSTQRYQGRLSFNPANKRLAWVEAFGTTDKIEELVMEINTDWTWVFNTSVSGENYYNNSFRIVIPANTFNNIANNKNNDEAIILPLNLEIDDDSPQLETVTPHNVNTGEFDLKFNEPVKGIDIEGDEVGETPSQLQHAESSKLPNIVVEYRGKDKDGNIVTENGTVTKYVSVKGKDDTIRIKADKSLLDLVDKNCYAEEWSFVVRNVTDDIGNSTTTTAQPFTIKHTPVVRQGFQVAKAEAKAVSSLYPGNILMPDGLNPADYDMVRVEFTDVIRITGNNDNAINKSNYKINGRDLGEGSLVLVDLFSKVDTTWNCLCRYPFEGYNAVYILTPKGSTMNKDTAGNYTNNTLEVGQYLMSKKLSWNEGTKLVGKYEFDLDWTLDGYTDLPVCYTAKTAQPFINALPANADAPRTPKLIAQVKEAKRIYDGLSGYEKLKVNIGWLEYWVEQLGL